MSLEPIWIEPDDNEDENQNKGMSDFDHNNMQDFNMRGAMGDDSDDKEGEESQVDPFVPDVSKNLDDLDADETQEEASIKGLFSTDK